MRKIKNRFVALLVVFTSIISFLPVGFGGQTANAAVSDATALRVKVTKQANELPSRVEGNEKIYTSEEVVIGDNIGFDLTVKDVRTTTEKLKAEAQADLNKANTVTGVIKQRVEIRSINGVKITSGDGLTDTGGILQEMGITINALTDGAEDPNHEKIIGKRILGLPYGINKIQYEVIVTTQTVSYTPPKMSADGKTQITPSSLEVGEEQESKNTSYNDLTIEHATKFVIQKIKQLMFKSYVGEESDFTEDDEISNDKNNQKPFLYSQIAKPDANMALRYNFDVPDSTFKLKYVMEFDQDLTNSSIYRNGARDNDVQRDGKSLQGSLERLGTSALIVIKVGGEAGAISKAYAIEIKYNTLNADKDYSMKDAGIKKYDFNESDSVKAYIGKKFNVEKDADGGFPIYNGDIYIDPKANQISIDPELILGKSGVAYKVANYFVDSGSSTTNVEEAILKSDGKRYVNFKRGSFSNTIRIDVYKGTDGNVDKSSSKILARYSLKVNPLTVETGDNFTTNIKIEKANDSDSIEPYLTQPGVKESGVEFSTSRRTYDLYYAPETSSVRVTFAGERSKKNEYLKVWLSGDVNSTNPKEAKESVNNKVGDDLRREKSLNVDLGTSAKMVVQAYYDDFEYETNPVTHEKTVKKDGNGNPICKSYSLGEKYVFYIPRNVHTTDPSGETSNNASLSSLKISGYSLKDSDGNDGFSSDKLDYATTVDKEDTSAKITAIAEDDNIKSMVATIDGGEESYDLTSGELSELPLNANGKTTIKIVVTAQDGTTTKKYTVVVKNNSKGSNVNLKNVILNVGDYTFDSKEDVTKVRVDQNVSSIKVTPIAEDPKAKVKVNGQEFSGSPISVSLKGSQKTEISIEVNSEDGTESKTYTLEVNRVDVADWNNDSNNEDDPNEDDQFYDEYSKSWVDLTKYDQWGSVNGKPAYFDKKSRQVKDAWITTGGKMYYLNNLGYRASGWKVDDKSGKTYYLDPVTGEMKKGWMNLDNKWYYFGLNGIMQKGWLNLNNKWYYFVPNGQMVTNQTMFIDDEVCRFGQDGAKY